MHDTSNAEPVLNDYGVVIGYILELAKDQWLPLNLAGNNYSGPSYHDDAIDIVKLKYANHEPPVSE